MKLLYIQTIQTSMRKIKKSWPEKKISEVKAVHKDYEVLVITITEYDENDCTFEEQSLIETVEYTMLNFQVVSPKLK